MPVNRYYKGHGQEVMSNMKDKYGEQQGERVFYATANKRGLNPGENPITTALKRGRRKAKKT